MAIVKWDPMRELMVMQEQMNRLLEASRERAGSESFDQGLWQPPVDIYEDDQEVVVKMEVPEVDQKDIRVHIEENNLIVHGVRKLEREDKKHNYHRIERNYGEFRRSFVLPASVNQGQTQAECSEGVLKIVLPKKDSPKSRQIEIKIKGEPSAEE